MERQLAAKWTAAAHDFDLALATRMATTLGRLARRLAKTCETCCVRRRSGLGWGGAGSAFGLRQQRGDGSRGGGTRRGGRCLLIPAHFDLGAGDGDKCPGGKEGEAAEQAEGSGLASHIATVPKGGASPNRNWDTSTEKLVTACGTFKGAQLFLAGGNFAKTAARAVGRLLSDRPTGASCDGIAPAARRPRVPTRHPRDAGAHDCCKA